MRNAYLISLICFFFVSTAIGCGTDGKMAHLRTGQLEDPPIFNSLNWPAPYSELPGGRLVISGNIQCDGGYYEEIPIFV